MVFLLTACQREKRSIFLFREGDAPSSGEHHFSLLPQGLFRLAAALLVVTFLHCQFLSCFSLVVTFASASWVRLPLPKTTDA